MTTSALARPRSPWLLIILMALVMFGPMAIDIFLPSIPAMMLDFNAPGSALQATITLFLLTMGLGQIVLGPLVDRIGRRPVLIAGIICYGLGAFIAAQAGSLEGLYAGRVLQGIGACATSIVTMAAVRDTFDPEKGARIFSYLNGVLCIVPALAPMLGGLLALQYGWRSNFFFMGIFAVATGMLVLWRFPETRPDHTDSSGRLYQWQRYRSVLFSRFFLYYALVCAAAMTLIITYVTYAPVVLIDGLGLSQIAFSLWFGGNACINILGFVLAPRLTATLGRKKMVTLALCIMLTGGLAEIAGVLWLQLGAMTYMLPASMICLGFSLGLGCASSLALELFPEKAGTASALLGCIQLTISSALASLVQQTALSGSLAVMGLTLLLIPALLFMRHTMTAEENRAGH
ncbi:multidrug effflux MFS transporter [Pokkaliibacter plantistimulans]|nr:multidrug effflux MFS transporter [Pokkaliibacter plantistimulans]